MGPAHDDACSSRAGEGRYASDSEQTLHDSERRVRLSDKLRRPALVGGSEGALARLGNRRCTGSPLRRSRGQPWARISIENAFFLRTGR